MERGLRIAFFGSPALAEACLTELLKGYIVSMVVTQPDKSAGRGRALTPTPAAVIAQREGIPLYKPQSLKADFADTLDRHRVDLSVVVAYGKLLPGVVINRPARGSINLHASLLPKYRGASPIQAALLSGEQRTGITVQKMKVEMDAGDILTVREIEIGSGWTAERLAAEIREVAPSFLRRAVENYITGKVTPVPQNEAEATFCSLIRKEDGLIDWKEDAGRICSKISAYNLWPVCYTWLDGKSLRLFNARAADLEGFRSSAGASETHGVPGCPETPGEVLALDKLDGILVRAGRGVVALLELQLENRKRIGHRDFMNGYRDLKGKILGIFPGIPGKIPGT